MNLSKYSDKRKRVSILGFFYTNQYWNFILIYIEPIANMITSNFVLFIVIGIRKEEKRN